MLRLAERRTMLFTLLLNYGVSKTQISSSLSIEKILVEQARAVICDTLIHIWTACSIPLDAPSLTTVSTLEAGNKISKRMSDISTGVRSSRQRTG